MHVHELDRELWLPRPIGDVFSFFSDAGNLEIRLWQHEHLFEERDGGTVCRDIVRYAVLFDILTHRFLVRPDLESIFEFRQRKMRELLSSPA